jgi:hypothetical protein
MALLKFKAFEKVRLEAKAAKIKENAAKKYKTFYLKTLEEYGVKDASELDDDKLAEFLETVKNYRKINETNK